MDYYSDNDPKVCAWLRELMAQGLIPEGVVDERPIQEIQGKDLDGYRHVHLFAGIAGWAEALRLAGWGDGFVWSGSCPCQPFSAAGKRKGEEDERHLWPSMFRLIRECRPPVVFGEQVSGDDGYRWLAGVQADLEAEGYAFGAADLPACGVGAPHRRYRLFWVAHATSERCGEMRRDRRRSPKRTGELGNAEALGDATSERSQEQWREYQPSGEGCGGLSGLAMQASVPQWNGPTIAVKCSDGARRVSAESGAFPLASRLPARVVRLRGYGNSIVPQVAAAFIQAFLEGLTH